MADEQDIYQVVRDDDFGEFHREVNRLMREGWIPLGGIAVISGSYANEDTRVEAARRFYQAMTRTPSPKPEPGKPNTEEMEFARTGCKVEAIQAYRIRTGMGLIESKRAIELALIAESHR